jgi:hypothetical protein
MEQIIDTLILKLGLDASDFQKKQREAGDTFRKTAESHVKHARESRRAPRVRGLLSADFQ